MGEWGEGEGEGGEGEGEGGEEEGGEEEGGEEGEGIRGGMVVAGEGVVRQSRDCVLLLKFATLFLSFISSFSADGELARLVTL